MWRGGVPSSLLLWCLIRTPGIESKAWYDGLDGVHVLSPGKASQDLVNNIFEEQAAEDAQFNEKRHAFLLTPGEYGAEFHIPVGYYTSVIGAGRTPHEVKLDSVSSTNWVDGHSTQNFWRSLEGVTLTNASILWSVSQGAPIRRSVIQGKLHLSQRPGYASGGFLADTVVQGTVMAGTQQQWLFRNADLPSGIWCVAGWNYVFVGVLSVSEETYRSCADNVVDKVAVEERTPRIAEKPFVVQEDDGSWRIYVPAFRGSGSVGPDLSGNETGFSRKLSLDHDVFIAKPGDSAVDINKGCESKSGLLLTPGIYRLKEPIIVKKSGFVVLGLGFPTLIPTARHSALVVHDELEDVRIAGVLLEAGAPRSKHAVEPLLQWGNRPEAEPAEATETSETSFVRHGKGIIKEVRVLKKDEQKKPAGVLSDLFVRVGSFKYQGCNVVQADVMVEINSDDVVQDNLWLWHADHDDCDTDIEKYGKSDDSFTEHGLVVNGNRVTTYGLSVEHVNGGDMVSWRGDDGEVYFYQSELPYHSAYFGEAGFAGYAVSKKVTSHVAKGLGVYIIRKPLQVQRAFVMPATAEATNLMTVVIEGEYTQFQSLVCVHAADNGIEGCLRPKNCGGDDRCVLGSLQRHVPYLIRQGAQCGLEGDGDAEEGESPRRPWYDGLKNVHVLQPGAKHSSVHSLWWTQDSVRQEFAGDRHAILLTPGTYPEDFFVPVSYYMSVHGVGSDPSRVQLSSVRSSNRGDSADHNNWRSCEGVTLLNDTVTWAVSQGSPLRRSVVRGDLHLSQDDGSARGGFMADVQVDGRVVAGTQHQWLFRNSNLPGGITCAEDGANYVFVGVGNLTSEQFKACEGDTSGKVTVARTTPKVAGKPFVVLEDDCNTWNIHVPAYQVDLPAGTAIGTISRKLNLDTQVFIARPGDTDVEINAGIVGKQGLLLTPGVYRMKAPLKVVSDGFVVLGLGFATLVATAGEPAITVAENLLDVRIAGIILEAGTPVDHKEAEPLLLWGHRHSHSTRSPEDQLSEQEPHPAGVLSDVIARVGAFQYANCSIVRADTLVKISSDDVVLDNLWLWHADHDDCDTMEQQKTSGRCICDHGLVVNGDRVVAYGAFTGQAPVRWNGEAGEMYFYQSELAAKTDYGYCVAPEVKSHQGFGMSTSLIDSAQLEVGTVVVPSGIELRNVMTLVQGIQDESEVEHARKEVVCIYAGDAKQSPVCKPSKNCTSDTRCIVESLTAAEEAAVKDKGRVAFFTQRSFLHRADGSHRVGRAAANVSFLSGILNWTVVLCCAALVLVAYQKVTNGVLRASSGGGDRRLLTGPADDMRGADDQADLGE